LSNSGGGPLQGLLRKTFWDKWPRVDSRSKEDKRWKLNFEYGFGPNFRGQSQHRLLKRPLLRVEVTAFHTDNGHDAVI